MTDQDRMRMTTEGLAVEEVDEDWVEDEESAWYVLVPDLDRPGEWRTLWSDGTLTSWVPRR